VLLPEPPPPPGAEIKTPEPPDVYVKEDAAPLVEPVLYVFVPPLPIVTVKALAPVPRKADPEITRPPPPPPPQYDPPEPPPPTTAILIGRFNGLDVIENVVELEKVCVVTDAPTTLLPPVATIELPLAVVLKILVPEDQ
jgi:hypothetical protein